MQIVTIPGRDYDSNVYVIPGQKPTIIDTGTGFHSPQIIQTIRQVCNLTAIQQILLTHEHFDHVGGANDLLRASNGTAKIFAHADIVHKLREGKSAFAEMIGGTMPRVTVDVPLSEATQLTIGDEVFVPLLTPGHSIGSLCFYNTEHGVLFSGDTLFAQGGFGRYDFPGGDLSSLVLSIERLAALDITSVYPGHGPIVEHKGHDHVHQSLQNIQMLV
ncbi:MAG: MBL fold metallo-hydrolase [Candidatus Thermoplasmatota archaeon]|nr:MBL fold metallo-hydrolase [Candidatus Thermoplasmatota archaeon]